MDPAHNGHPVHRHEHSDIRVKAIVMFVVGLAVCGIALHFVMSGVWWWFGKTMAPVDARSPFAGPRELPPQPRLQVTPRADLAAFLEAERNRLNSYGTDAATGAIHIPIDRAIDLIAERGLPSRATPREQRRTPDAARK